MQHCSYFSLGWYSLSCLTPSLPLSFLVYPFHMYDINHGLSLSAVSRHHFFNLNPWSFVALKCTPFTGAYLWNTLKDEVKRAGPLTKFKKSFVKWDGKPCNCLICELLFPFYLHYSLNFVFLFIIIFII